MLPKDFKNVDWKSKCQNLLSNCQTEIKKTTAIGKKMIMASKTNTELHQVYEALGRKVFAAIKSDELKWDDDEVRQIIECIDRSQEDLNHYEEEVTSIKKGDQE